MPRPYGVNCNASSKRPAYMFRIARQYLSETRSARSPTLADENLIFLATCLNPLVTYQPRPISRNSSARPMEVSIGHPHLLGTPSKRVASTNRRKVLPVLPNTDNYLWGFTANLGRYHLYVSYGCPWASRTLIVRKLKGLEDIISVSFVSPRMDSNGWPFACVDPFPGAEDDPIYNAKHLKDVYLKVEPQYQGRWVA